MKRTCPVCKKGYDDGGDEWKSKCYDCYKNFRSAKRIQTLSSYGPRQQNIYLTHPDVTKEELTAWIETNKTGYGWGPQKWDEAAPGYKKFQIWIDSTNFD